MEGGDDEIGGKRRTGSKKEEELVGAERLEKITEEIRGRTRRQMSDRQQWEMNYDNGMGKRGKESENP